MVINLEQIAHLPVINVEEIYYSPFEVFEIAETSNFANTKKIHYVVGRTVEELPTVVYGSVIRDGKVLDNNCLRIKDIHSYETIKKFELFTKK